MTRWHMILLPRAVVFLPASVFTAFRKASALRLMTRFATVFPIKRCLKAAPNQDLVAITKECMRRGVEACKPWAFIGDIGAAIAPFARKHGYSVVTEFGGHGVGVDFHEEPFVCHDSKKNTGMLMVPGMVFTVEPMINAGRRDVFIDASNDWTVYTQDGSMSAQWENTVLVTDTGVEVLAW